MNSFVASKYVENIQRIALGIRPLDPIIGRGLMRYVRIEIEYAEPHESLSPSTPLCTPQHRGVAPRQLCRHHSGRFSVLYYPGIKSEMTIRLYDTRRYYVPRRLSIPLMSLADVLSLEAHEERDYLAARIREPVLFPGAAYEICSRSTGLRGRVLRGGKPMRWAVIEARLAGTNVVVGRARGDDRGEFLLIIAPTATPEADFDSSGEVSIEVRIAGPGTAPTATTAAAEIDSFWDLPVEVVPPVTETDDVSTGEQPPQHYTFATHRTINFKLGRVLSGVQEDPFIFPP